ncbi:MAG: glycosyltransferase family 4 protein [Promethearchaeota archaeon]
MRILVMAQYFPPDIGGASTRVYNIVKGLKKLKHEVTVVAAFPNYPHGKIPKQYRRKIIEFEKLQNVKVIRVWVPPLPHEGFAKRLLLHLAFMFSTLFALPVIGKVDIIWAANPNFFSFYSALIYSLVKKCPVVRNVDDLWPEAIYDLGWIKSKILRRIINFASRITYKLSAAITPVSPGYVKTIVEKYRINKNKIHVIEVGVNTEIFHSRNISKDDSKGKFTVMYSGILSIGYDFDIILKAARLLQNNEKIEFVIRGSGEYASRIKRKINELNLKNVKLLVGRLDEHQLTEMLGLADVFLLPMNPAAAVDDGLPTKIFEYQAFGKPIICASKGEPARYIRVTESGLIIEPGNYDALSKAILSLYENKRLALDLGSNGWTHVSELLSYEKLGERMLEVFSNVINHKLAS